MTRRISGLVVLIAVALVSGVMVGCTKKPTAAELQIQNLQGENANLQRQLDEREQDIQSKDAEIARLKEAGSATATRVGPGVSEVITVSDGVLFGPGSATLTTAGKHELDKHIGTIKSQYGGRHISVEGHTDSTPLRKTKEQWGNNIWLSANRAKAVADYLISQGVPENLVSIVGHGASRPKGGGAAQDRRVEIVVMNR